MKNAGRHSFKRDALPVACCGWIACPVLLSACAPRHDTTTVIELDSQPQLFVTICSSTARDGFGSLEATSEGTVVTPPVRFEGSMLTLNATTRSLAWRVSHGIPCGVSYSRTSLKVAVLFRSRSKIRTGTRSPGTQRTTANQSSATESSSRLLGRTVRTWRHWPAGSCVRSSFSATPAYSRSGFVRRLPWVGVTCHVR